MKNKLDGIGIEPLLTQNVLEIRALAETYARQSGSPSVRESDLLWALLTNGEDSKGYRGFLKQFAIDTDQIKRRLAARYPPPESPPQSSVVFETPIMDVE